MAAAIITNLPRPVSSAVAEGDFNGDGRLDVAVACFEGDIVSILPGNGGGVLQTALNFATRNTSQSVAVGDFNRDGKVDLAMANGDIVSILINTMR